MEKFSGRAADPIYDVHISSAPALDIRVATTEA